jgi:hypothetical protein
MTDSFLLLTPLLVGAIVALLGFIGCDKLFGLEHIDSHPSVTGLTAAGGNMQVSLSWDALDGATDYHVIRQQGSSSVDIDTMSTATAYVDTMLPNNTAFTYQVYANTTGEDSQKSTPVSVTTSAAIQFVQPAAQSQAVNPPISVTLNNTAQGNCLIAAVSYGGPAAGSVNVSDNHGNVFNFVGSGPWLRQSRLFFLPNIPGGNVTITATGAGGATGPCNMCVCEYSGVDLTSGALYSFSTKASPNTGTAGLETLKGVTVNLAQSGDGAYLVVFSASPTALTPAGGFNVHATSETSILIEDSFSSIAATQTVATDDTTGGSFVPWVILAVGVKF